MKLSKATQWILTIGILAILIVGAGVAYGRQMAEQGRLNADMAQANQDFVNYTVQKKDLETRLGQANSRISSLKKEFCKSTESVEIGEALFEAADKANVTITGFTSSTPAEKELNGTTYRVFTVDVAAEGEMVALLNFSRKVSESFGNSNIGSVGVKVPRASEEGTSQGKPTMSLSLEIYAYED